MCLVCVCIYIYIFKPPTSKWSGNAKTRSDTAYLSSPKYLLEMAWLKSTASSRKFGELKCCIYFPTTLGWLNMSALGRQWGAHLTSWKRNRAHCAFFHWCGTKLSIGETVGIFHKKNQDTSRYCKYSAIELQTFCKTGNVCHNILRHWTHHSIDSSSRRHSFSPEMSINQGWSAPLRRSYSDRAASTLLCLSHHQSPSANIHWSVANHPHVCFENQDHQQLWDVLPNFSVAKC